MSIYTFLLIVVILFSLMLVCVGFFSLIAIICLGIEQRKLIKEAKNFRPAWYDFDILKDMK